MQDRAIVCKDMHLKRLILLGILGIVVGFVECLGMNCSPLSPTSEE